MEVLVMKKVIALALTVVMAFMLSIATFAEAKIPTEDFTVKASGQAPTIDGVFDAKDGWGDPIFTVKGSDVWDYADAGAGDFQPWPITSVRMRCV